MGAQTLAEWRSGGAAQASAVPGATASPATIAELQRQLRSDLGHERIRAEMELDRLGAPVHFDRQKNSFFKPLPHDTDAIDWWVELRDEAIFATWRVWFGPELFIRGTQPSSALVALPQFARYTFTVTAPDGTKVEREYEAVAGENAMSGIHLADAGAPGDYRIDLFMHVQYVTPSGEARILNNSETGLELRK
jgi:hypothetical protein